MDSSIDEQPILSKSTVDLIWELFNSDVPVPIGKAEHIAKCKIEFWKAYKEDKCSDADLVQTMTPES